METELFLIFVQLTIENGYYIWLKLLVVIMQQQMEGREALKHFLNGALTKSLSKLCPLK